MAKKVIPFKVHTPARQEIVVPFKVHTPVRQEIVVPFKTSPVPQEEIVLKIEKEDTPVDVDEVKNTSAKEIDYDALIKLCMKSDKLDETTKNELASNLRELRDIQDEIDGAEKELNTAVTENMPMLKAFKEKFGASIKKVNSAKAKWTALANKFVSDQKILMAKLEASSKK